MKDFTELERAVLSKLLDGGHPVLAQLRSQLRGCRVTRREFSGVGFFTTLEVNKDAPRVGDKTIRIGDVVADIEGLAHGAGFVLFIDHGKITMLEGFTYDEPWPDTIRSFTLSYTRDWQKLADALK